MNQIFYIDGYNVIHELPELEAMMSHDIELAREKLIEYVLRWSSTSGETAKIIFDGQGKHTQASPHHEQTGPVEVIFSSKHKTADSIIERAVYRAKTKGSVIVVSGDRGITDLCMGMGALVMHPRNFWVSVGESTSETKRALQQNRISEGSRLEDGWDADTLDRLNELKKRLGG
ncbi:MAG: NYN domain-containing protein [Candidatus Hydrogenedentota bacterium]